VVSGGNQRRSVVKGGAEGFFGAFEGQVGVQEGLCSIQFCDPLDRSSA